MDTRKIQNVGGGTFTVSLPREWAQAEGISQGDVVNLHTHIDGVLVVQTRDREPDPTGDLTVDLGGTDTDRIRQSLWAAYTAGYTEVTLTARDSFTEPQREVAREVANVLAGATVTTATDGQIVFRVLLDPEAVSVRQLVRQLSFVALSMHRNAMAAVTDDRPDPDVSDRDDQADRLFATTERSFARALSRLGEVDALGVTRPELFELWSTARELERVADHAERISTVARGLDRPPQEAHLTALQELAECAQEIVDRAVRSVVDEERTGPMCEALGLRAHVREEAAELDRRLFGDATADYRLARVLDSVRRTAEHGGNIAERGLQRAVRNDAELSLNPGETVAPPDAASLQPTGEDD